MNALADRLTGRWETPVAILLALGIAASLAQGLWFFLGGAETDVVVGPAAPAVADDPVAPRGLPAARIAAMNLFGDAEADALGLGDALDAPETRLQLELHGVFLSGIAANSSAIVAERNRDGKLYRVGDRLPGNAELAQVLGDRIVLRRAGGLETLRFEDATEGGGFARVGGASSGARPRSAFAPRSGTVDDGGPAGRRFEAPTDADGAGADPTASPLRSAIERYQDQLRVDPEGTLSSLGVEPVSVGAASGYRLGGGEVDAATLSRVGLRPGDVVLSVNGQAVGDVQADQQQLQSIMDAGSARLEIQRGERRFFVTTRIP